MKSLRNIQLDDQPERLDKILTNYLPDLSRSSIQKLIKDNKVLVNGKVEKGNFIVQGDETIQIELDQSEEPLNVEPENLPLDIIYEDEDIIVINKPAGLVVHPSKGHPNHTLVNRLVYHFNQLSSQAGELRPGIVHRIDKDTSGLLVVAKNNFTHQSLSEQLQDHAMGRQYLALVLGEMNTQSGVIDIPLKRDPKNRLKYTGDPEGKTAITHFVVRERYQGATLVEAKLKTGRTHQIRAHFEAIGHPIVGDPIYRQNLPVSNAHLSSMNDGQLLHAYQLHLNHPVTNKPLVFEAPIPNKMHQIIQALHPLIK